MYYQLHTNCFSFSNLKKFMYNSWSDRKNLVTGVFILASGLYVTILALIKTGQLWGVPYDIRLITFVMIGVGITIILKVINSRHLEDAMKNTSIMSASTNQKS